MSLLGKVALVTGAAQGLGRSICYLLLERKCRVALVDISEDVGESTNKELQSIFGKDFTVFQQCDISSYEEFEKSFQMVKSLFGKIDFLVNNAAILNETDWQRMLDINVQGTVNGVKLALQYMSIVNGGYGGSIVNISSIAALHPETHDFCAVYTGSKSFILSYSQALSTSYHFQKHNIRINAVCPDAIKTLLVKNVSNFEFMPKSKNTKYLEPEEVAAAVVKVLEHELQGRIILVSQKGIENITLNKIATVEDFSG